MIYKYILIDTKEAEERAIEDKLEKHPNIVDINPLVIEETAKANPFFENYNVVIKIKAKSIEEIQNIIHSDLKPIPGINHMKIYSKPNSN